MNQEEQLQTEFEISMPPEFFFHDVLTHLAGHGYKYTVAPAVGTFMEYVTLTSLTKINEGIENPFSLTLTSVLLDSLLREKLISLFILTNHGDHRSLYRARTEEEAAQGLKHLGGSLRLYEGCGDFIEGLNEKQRGRLPFMAYHCAVDGFTVTHVQQAFFAEYSDARDTLELFGYEAGCGAVYVCIDDRGSS